MGVVPVPRYVPRYAVMNVDLNCSNEWKKSVYYTQGSDGIILVTYIHT